MTIHRWLTGFFLLVLMVLTLFINAWVFSARSFQENFARVTGNGSGVVSMRAIQQASREVATLEAQAAPKQLRVAGLDRQIEDANARIDSLVKRLEEGAGALAAKVAAVEEKAKITAGDSGVSYTAVASRVLRLELTPEAPAADVAALRQDVDLLAALNTQITEAEEAKRPLDAAARALQTEINDDRQRLLSQKNTFGGNFEQVETEIESLRHSSPFGVGAALAQVHPTFLSALLVCLMGALGSLLFLFPAYIANKPGMQITFDTIVVRTVFGAVVAFAFFIVANLGMAVFGMSSTGAAAPPTAASLNPFTVAGLGIVAGVMGDDIAKWIHDRGAYLFKTAGEGGGLADIAKNVTAQRRAPSAPAIAPDPSDLPSGGLANPHGGPHDPA